METSTATQIVLPWEYPFIVLTMIVLCLITFFAGFASAGHRKHFTPEFMAQWEKEHEEAFPGTKPATGGNPDEGEGRYSSKLPYKAWVEFNNAVRVH